MLFFNTCHSVDYYSRLFKLLPSLKGVTFLALYGQMK